MRHRILLCFLAFAGFATSAQAQSTLIHYWNFNNLTGTYKNPNIPKFDADYSILDTSKAYLQYYLKPGVSSNYAGYIDGYTPTPNNENIDADTLNARNGSMPGVALRVRNPVDSSELRWHIPTTGYSGIVIKYALDSSSLTSGDSTQHFSYSPDGGTTWETTNITVNGQTADTLNTTAVSYYGDTNWGLVTITLGSDANNNANLIFRIFATGNASKTSGNLRYDNVTVEGVPTSQPLALIHYWNFNGLTGTYKVPNVPKFDADFSILDTSKAYLQYYLLPNTSSNYGGYIDGYTPTLNSENIDADTLNARIGATPGEALRVRNPVDSVELRWHIPTTGYTGIVIKYALESSSLTNGDSTQHFSYSPDGGTTWKTTNITVNGQTTDTLNTTAAAYYGDTNWGLVTITLGSDADNNANLIFRIVATGNASKTSGNLRYDNVTVEGMGASVQPPAFITMTAPAIGTLLEAGRQTTISFTTSGTVGEVRKIQFSPDGGTTWQDVTSETGATTYQWTVPNTPTTMGEIRVVDSANVMGTSKQFTIVAPGTGLIVHYWNFNWWTSASYHNPGIPAIPSDYSGNLNHIGSIQYVLDASNKSYLGYLDNVPGDTVNARFGSIAGSGMRVRNPTDSMELRWIIPTKGYQGISITYALQSSSLTGPQVQKFDYSTDGGVTWTTSGLTVNGSAQDTLDVTQSQYQQATAFAPVTIGFSGQTSVNNNPNLIFRMKFGDTATDGTSGNNRIDNFAVVATALDGV